MALPSSVLAGIFLFALTSAQKDNGNECSCFLTNGSSSGYFSYHRFHDFRNVAGASATPPTVISNENNATEAFATSDFFLSDAWQNDWQIQNWNNRQHERFRCHSPHDQFRQQYLHRYLPSHTSIDSLSNNGH